MKESFFDYYSPTPGDYEILWKEGLIVLDANVLLDLYRSPATAREELITVLEALKERLWIPYQAALEFQRNRLTVISTERKATEDALAVAKELVSELRQKVESLQIDKHGLDLQPDPLIADLEQANTKLINAIDAVHKLRPDITAADPIRERLDHILSGKVGPGPACQAELDALVEGGEQRFADRIPPGYADADKEKNPHLAAFFHGHIRYARKFGDLILWRQLMNYVKSQNIKSVILVTADRKDDWWWREHGKTIGVQPELVREIRRVGGVNLFWMYSPVQFLENAKTYTKAKVSDQAVAELQEVAESPRRTFISWSSPAFRSRGARETHRPARRTLNEYKEIEGAVYEWLSETYGDVLRMDQFPDFVVPREDELHGYEVKFAPTFNRSMILTPPIIQSILRGYLEIKEGRLSAFTMIIVITIEDFVLIRERLDQLRGRLGQILNSNPISDIIVGVVLPNGRFEPIIQQILGPSEE